jgi:hypothetical protein
MLTLLTFGVLWGLFSYYRLNKHCKEIGVEFNPLLGTIFDWIGFVVGIAMLAVVAVAICINNFP